MNKLYFLLPLLMAGIMGLATSCGDSADKKEKNRNIVALPDSPTPIDHTPYVITDSSAIRTLDGGIQLYVVEEGTGPLPEPGSNVIIHYHGMLLDGSVFDSSFQKGQKQDFSLNALIQGWQIGLTQVKAGSKIKLIIPPEMGYGAQARPNIPANSTLVFDIDLYSSYMPG